MCPSVSIETHKFGKYGIIFYEEGNGHHG